MTLSPEKLGNFLVEAVEGDFCALWVAYHNEVMIGLFGAMVLPMTFHDGYMASDVAIYLDPQYRSSRPGWTALTQMVQEYRSWAKRKPGINRVMVGAATGINDDKAAKSFERLGAKPAGKMLEF